MKAEDFKYLVLGRCGGNHFVIFATNSFMEAQKVKARHTNNGKNKRKIVSIWRTI